MENGSKLIQSKSHQPKWKPTGQRGLLLTDKDSVVMLGAHVWEISTLKMTSVTRRYLFFKKTFFVKVLILIVYSLYCFLWASWSDHPLREQLWRSGIRRLRLWRNNASSNHHYNHDTRGCFLTWKLDERCCGLSFHNAFTNHSIKRSGSENTGYQAVMMCTKKDHPDMAEWFDGAC